MLVALALGLAVPLNVLAPYDDQETSLVQQPALDEATCEKLSRDKGNMTLARGTNNKGASKRCVFTPPNIPSVHGDPMFKVNGIGTLATGQPGEAALGLASYLRVDEFELFEARATRRGDRANS